MPTLLVKLKKCDEIYMRRNLLLDLVWCLATMVLTATMARLVGNRLAMEYNVGQMDLFAGIFHALIYLQAITLMVLALSFISDRIYRSRTIITLCLPILICTVAWFIVEPEPVDPMYRYGAMIVVIGISFYKLKSYAQLLLMMFKVEKSTIIPKEL